MKTKIDASPVSGSTTVIALLMLVVVSMIGANVLLNVQSRYNATIKAAGWQEALWGAEAGADVALANIRWTVVKSSPTPWSGWQKQSGSNWVNLTSPEITDASTEFAANRSIRYIMPTMTQTGEGTNQVWAVVTVDAPSATNPAGLNDNFGNQWYRVRSTGYAGLPGLSRVTGDLPTDSLARHDNALRKFSLCFDRFTGTALTTPQATRTIETLIQPKTPFVAAIATNTSFSGPGSAGSVDSYDSSDPTKSTNGLYDPSKRQQHGDVINNTANFAVGGTIYGDVGTNGGNVAPSSSITGQIDNSVSTYLPPVPTPNWTVISPTPTIVTSNTSIAAGTTASPTYYKITRISKDLTITLPSLSTTGTANIWIPQSGGGAELSGRIIVEAGVTCKIYIEGDIAMKAQDFDNQNNIPTYLQIYGLTPSSGNTQTFDIQSPGNFCAAVYAPSADVTFTGNASISGAVVANSFSGNGVTGVHYDESLAGFGTPIDYRRASWVEDDR
jgi:hypothetical protein